MDAPLQFLEDLKRQGLEPGALLGLLHIMIGRKISRTDGELISKGLTWRELAGYLKKARWPIEQVTEMGLNPDTDNFTVIGIGDMSGDVFGNGMLMSEHIRISDGSGIAFTFSRAAGADSANSITKRPDRRSRRNCCLNISSTSGSSSTTTM